LPEDVRTIQRLVKEVRPPDPTDTWSVTNSDTDEAAAVLPVLAATVKQRAGAPISCGEAIWIHRVSTLAPGLSSQGVWFLARAYFTRELRHQDAGDLDALLAFAPWRSQEHRERYTEAIQEELVPQAPLYVAAATWIGTRPQVRIKDEEGNVTVEDIHIPIGWLEKHDARRTKGSQRKETSDE
jgi:hypothetical protein